MVSALLLLSALCVVKVLGHRGLMACEILVMLSVQMLMENRSISFMIYQTRLRGRAAGVTPPKNFCHVFSTVCYSTVELGDVQKVNPDRNQLKLTGNKQCKHHH